LTIDPFFLEDNHLIQPRHNFFQISRKIRILEFPAVPFPFLPFLFLLLLIELGGILGLLVIEGIILKIRFCKHLHEFLNMVRTHGELRRDLPPTNPQQIL
jgi:hypothetical protein